ncbi:thrombospondin type 3 repeat-containing protein [endosymbiont of Ridgeia piscesae]|jgi:outer membrane protein OmpA-like peptidoglycan-associated protein|uniref:Thrombospondin type 3 repeat-containing protein n=1 Tax=endosymbiont of Ridgeia piscesae TaxID=54398 RepID=A0A0T5YUG0_9GAMM|nr:thrombospondin type 3 repeat-containing protein [endosymbiont of Ridgeia piscesae]KRT54260.1 Thrombospondin type 3 repeat/OmpA family [endosymbiont of Ridgeia piscesae]KRT57981.1 Thrombospondin type 3 repeat-containing protein [endosymbiont of Ridgeia piscesae]
MASIRTFISLFGLLASGLLASSAYAEVTSENIIYLQTDGRSSLFHRALRGDASKLLFHVTKSLELNDFYYIYPNKRDWDGTSDPAVNTLVFNQGEYVVVYPEQLSDQLSLSDDGIYTFTTREEKRADGHFGMWYKPGDFDNFVYAWVLPKGIELISYESNRDGEWVKRENTITYYGHQVNDLVFTIRYRLSDSDQDGIVDNLDHCPKTAPGILVNNLGCALDTDGDGIDDSHDKCRNTPQGAVVDTDGCRLDNDGDLIPDTLDRCPATPQGAQVKPNGCEVDSDNDGVVNSQDDCPATPSELSVDLRGCETDRDQDQVVDHLDQCPNTPASARVDSHGCETDQDGDSVIDRLDQCPNTAAGREVTPDGCERILPPQVPIMIDTDKDGVADEPDQCPGTGAGFMVDNRGCELDQDSDAVIDRLDQCPGTPAEARVDNKGCETDLDGDQVVDRLDQCPNTPADKEVSRDGCEIVVADCPEIAEPITPIPASTLDSDQDGIFDDADLCPNTAAGKEVDTTGCSPAEVITLHGVNFKTDSDQLTQGSVSILDKVARTLIHHQGLRLMVAGHTDSRGDAAYNKDLSHRRAITVMHYLSDNGVAAERLSAEGFGEEQPISDNESLEGQTMNRRVELIRMN